MTDRPDPDPTIDFRAWLRAQPPATLRVVADRVERQPDGTTVVHYSRQYVTELVEDVDGIPTGFEERLEPTGGTMTLLPPVGRHQDDDDPDDVA